MLAPLAGRMAVPAAASLSRQSGRLAMGAALAALAFSFAAPTAIFNTTYNGQALVDAQLTNGADVAITGTTEASATARFDDIRSVPGVAAAEPMQHRFAYVGADLQDIYGINPGRIDLATHIADAFFADHNARANLARLAIRWTVCSSRKKPSMISSCSGATSSTCVCKAPSIISTEPSLFGSSES
jgi:putative ABC transport system permease protein